MGCLSETYLGHLGWSEVVERARLRVGEIPRAALSGDAEKIGRSFYTACL